ncbi:uncharacterized protein LOC117331789 [Pecten maximus]|uniref:uncharacterized protein LOC117331789 n=1 Tax=Pecten maximus TaxID=6579 RepID=UPI001458CCB0|nr:uncharacterized protein LOC117331789 [Pecten maximus]
MFPCGPNKYLYDPYKQYCKMNGQVGRCDPSACFMRDAEWERLACSLYCGDNNGVNCPTVQEEGTVFIWKIMTGVLVAIVCVMICGVIAYFCKNHKKNTTPPVTKCCTKPMEKADPEETKVFIGDNNTKAEIDSAIGSSTSQSIEKYSMIPPQNNHEDPHTTRESRTAIAITSGTEEVRRHIEEGGTDRKECSS